MDTVQFFSYHTNQNCIVIHPTTAKQVILQWSNIRTYNPETLKEDEKFLLSSIGRDKCNTLYVTQVVQQIPTHRWMGVRTGDLCEDWRFVRRQPQGHRRNTVSQSVLHGFAQPYIHTLKCKPAKLTVSSSAFAWSPPQQEPLSKSTGSAHTTVERCQNYLHCEHFGTAGTWSYALVQKTICYTQPSPLCSQQTRTKPKTNLWKASCANH